MVSETKLSAIDRNNMQRDLFALSLFGELSLDIYFDFIKAYSNETSSFVKKFFSQTLSVSALETIAAESSTEYDKLLPESKYAAFSAIRNVVISENRNAWFCTKLI